MEEPLEKQVTRYLPWLNCRSQSVLRQQSRHRGLGIEYQRKGDFEAAILELRDAISLEPRDFDAH